MEKEKLNVCKTMFLSTFDISEGVACTVFQKTDEQGILVQKDGRGSRPYKQKNQNQLDDSGSFSDMVDYENFDCTSTSS